MKPEITLLAITPNAEKLIEQAGRTCYLSFDKEKEGSAQEFIKMIIRSGHLSVLEHAYATFRIKGGSRSFTHQIVRHRLASFSQQSQRYVDDHNFNYVIPPTIAGNEEARAVFDQFMADTREAYAQLVALGIPRQDARFVLPNAVTSEIVVSANFREWRHIFEVRCHAKAQWEIRTIVLEMLKLLREQAPTVFGDFIIDEERKTATIVRS